MLRLSFGVVCLLCLGSPGCGSGSDGGQGGSSGSGPVVVSEETYASALADAACSGGAKCCAEQGKSYDAMSCLMSVGMFVGFVPLMQAQAKALGLKWDQAAAEACVAELRAAASACGAATLQADQCVVYPPNVAEGQPCEQDMQCIPPPNGRAECHWPVSGDKTCLAIGFVAEGAKCGEPTTECDPNAGLFCDSASQTCKKQLAEGGACFGDEQCAEGLRCNGSLCAKLAAVGAPCGSSDACESGTCVENKCGAAMDLVCH